MRFPRGSGTASHARVRRAPRISGSRRRGEGGADRPRGGRSTFDRTARHGRPRRSPSRHAPARRGAARAASVRPVLARRDAGGLGVARPGAARPGAVWPGTARHGRPQRGPSWHSPSRHSPARHGLGDRASGDGPGVVRWAPPAATGRPHGHRLRRPARPTAAAGSPMIASGGGTTPSGAQGPCGGCPQAPRRRPGDSTTAPVASRPTRVDASANPCPPAGDLCRRPGIGGAPPGVRTRLRCAGGGGGYSLLVARSRIAGPTDRREIAA